MASKSIQGDTLHAWIHAVMAAGTWLTVSSQANTPAQATMIST